MANSKALTLVSVTATAIACVSGWQYSAERNHRIAAQIALNTTERELAAAHAEIVQLKEKPVPPLPSPAPVAPAPPQVSAAANPSPLPSPESTIGSDNESGEIRQAAATARVSAIAKFVQLTDDQRERLAEKFKREAQGDSETESLEAIIGEENVTFYRNQVARAFDRARDESIEKEMLYLSRKLSMSRAQEAAVFTAMRDAEKNVDEELRDRTFSGKLERMLAEERLKQERISDALKGILSPEQYQAYLRNLSESSATDFTSLHGE